MRVIAILVAAGAVASKGGARFLGLEHELGTLRERKLADLVILDGNPFGDIRNTQPWSYAYPVATSSKRESGKCCARRSSGAPPS